MKKIVLEWLHHIKECLQLLIREKVKVDLSEDKYGFTPLHLGAIVGREECMEILIRAGANVDARDDFGRAPLHLAAKMAIKSVCNS